uniref:MFS domain-containing protein n=1 Tax=Syphacia muris TaxID=451379 RepID=A0A0N5AJ43_9BILA
MELFAEVGNGRLRSVNKRKLISLAVLLITNLLNYIDRFTIAGVLTQLQSYFRITDDDSKAGLLQTAFIVFYMFFCPVFGYLGDRYSRKVVLSVGISLWVIAVFTSTLISSNHFFVFMLFRGIVGVGEASYSTVAPTIIADLYSGCARSAALSVFYFAIPVGSGLGFIFGSNISILLGSWQWGVRLTSVFGVLCLLLIIFAIEEPVRGESDRACLEKSVLLDDLKYLFKIKTYCMTTAGFTAVVFLVGSLSWWTPTLMEHAWALQHGTTEVSPTIKAKISSNFGIITCFAGTVGVIMGSFVAQIWKRGNSLIAPNKKADPYVCAIGALAATPLLFSALYLAEKHVAITWVLIFLGITCCCLNWAVNMDMLMYIVVPQCRSIATAVQTLISHLFGDATSPYFIGRISDVIRGGDESVIRRYLALQHSLYAPLFMLVVAGGFYLAASFTVDDDRELALSKMHASELEPIVAPNVSETSPLLDAVEQTPVSQSI